MKMVHPSGIEKEAPEGFSWMTLLFGCIIPLTRGDLKWFAIFLAMQVFNVLVMPEGINIITGLLFNLAFAFTYNAKYRDELLLKGFAAKA